jgi:lysozyme family protein
MIGRFDDCLARVLREEGGYINNPRDPGGATNMGITIAELSRWRGITSRVTADDVKNLSRAEASAIYKAHYWDAIHGDDLPAGVDLAVFDSAVNSGCHRASEWLQGAAGCSPVDGIIGHATLATVASRNPHELIQAVLLRRMDFDRSLPSWVVFGRGWADRVARVRSAALVAASPAGDRHD